MKNLILDNPAGQDKMFNIGDDIQVIAASQFYSVIDNYITKDKLCTYSGENAKIIMNGWFMHNPENWPPSNKITPKLVSFHLNSAAQGKMLDSKGVEFLKQNEPIGCRDTTTLQLIEAKGIKAYYSGCITLTLQRSKFTSKEERSGVIINDVSYKIARSLSNNFLKRLFNGDIKKQVIYNKNNKIVKDYIKEHFKVEDITYTEHSIPMLEDSLDVRHKAAKNLLKKYAEAELVVTSRIHCALPCLALGTPVLFLDDSLNHSTERSRLEGLIDLFHIIKIDANNNKIIVPKEIENLSSLKSLKNKTEYIGFRNRIVKELEGF